MIDKTYCPSQNSAVLFCTVCASKISKKLVLTPVWSVSYTSHMITFNPEVHSVANGIVILQHSTPSS